MTFSIIKMISLGSFTVLKVGALGPDKDEGLGVVQVPVHHPTAVSCLEVAAR